MYEYQDIIVTIEDQVATIKFNRAASFNTFTPTLKAEVVDALKKFATDDAVGAIVITGDGKHFCAGGDIKAFKTRIENKDFLDEDDFMKAAKLSLSIKRCPKPVIAMINGTASGGGCSISLACDFRFMQHGSKLNMSFINMGFSGDTVGMYHLERLVGVARTTEMMMTGEPVNAEEAACYGLAKMTADGALVSETYQFAKKLASKPLFAIARQKALMEEFFYQDLDKYTMKECNAMRACGMSEDHAEAVYAFLEKRPPVFHGK